MAIAEIRRWRRLEEENRKPKQLVTDLTLDKVILQEVLADRLQWAPAAWLAHRSRVFSLRTVSERGQRQVPEDSPFGSSTFQESLRVDS